MTMRELARLSGVSVSTVSKAFSDAPDIGDETREHIFAVAKQYGCYGKFYKKKYPKRVVAILTCELSAYYTGFVRRLESFIEQNGGIAVVAEHHFDTARQAELIEYFASYLHVDGILVFDLHAEIKKGYEIPIVSLFTSRDMRVDSVLSDVRDAMEAIVSRLYENGHRRIAFFGEPLTVSKESRFYKVAEGYRDLEVCAFRTEMRFEEAGEDCVKQWIDARDASTALVCAYDDIAIGAMKALQLAGYAIPEDVSVVGMDNISTAPYLDSALSSVDMCPDEICAAAWELLWRKQKNPYYRSNKDIVVKAKYIERASVGRAKCVK